MSAKGVALSDMLASMHPINWTSNRNASPIAFATQDNKSKYNHAFDFAKRIDSPDAKAVLANPKSKAGEVKGAADILQDCCMARLMELEKQVGIRDRNDKGSARIKPTTLSIGMRYQKIKSMLEKQLQERRKRRRIG